MLEVNKNTVFMGVAILVILVTGVLLFVQMGAGKIFPFTRLSNDALAQKSLDYINKNILESGKMATLQGVWEESGLVKIKIKVDSSDYDSYVTKDGRLLFPINPIQLDAPPTGGQATINTTQPSQQAIDSLTKADTTLVEAYVVSRCPYGLQIQRAMADAVKNIPALAQYLKVRYIGSVENGKIYAMHDRDANNQAIPNGAEGIENLRQICLREEQASTYWDYVACQMQKGDTKGCEATAKVNSATLSACVAQPARGLIYAKVDFDLSQKYNAKASPTVIVNGATASEFDFGGRSSNAMKNLVCESSTNKPAFCSTQLNIQPAAPSFSTTYTSSQQPVSATTNTSNCAPATPS